MLRALAACAVVLFSLSGAMRKELLENQVESGMAAASSGRRSASEEPKNTIWEWMGGDMISIDHEEAEEKLRSAAPEVLQDSERVQMAFKCGNHKTFFTDRRIIHRPKGTIQTSRMKYDTLPYTSIAAFSIEQAGSWLDMDSELKLWTETSREKFQASFRKGKVDIHAVHSFIMDKVMGPDPGPGSLLEGMSSELINPKGLLHWLGSNMTQIDPSEAEEHFRKGLPILRSDEKVKMAFRIRQDTTLLTTKRLLIVDTNFMNKKNVEFRSIPYSSIKAFAVETAGFLDLDAEFGVWTGIRSDYSMNAIHFDVRNSVDVQEIQGFLADMVLGVGGNGPPPPGEKNRAGPQAKLPPADLLGWLGNDFTEVDAGKAEQDLRAKLPTLLRDDEMLEMAFKVGRDKAFLTTKRILLIDTMGLTGKRVEFLSLPYASIHAFAVQSAGGFTDTDAEVMVWTAIEPPSPPEVDDGDTPPPPPPGKTFIKLDIRRGGGDIFKIQGLLARKVLGGGGPGASLLQEQDLASPRSARNPANFFHWLGQNARQVDPETVEQKFREDMPILLSGETVDLVFKVGKNTTILTSDRVILVGEPDGIFKLFGTQVMYKSVPYKSVRGFDVESAGSWDTDAEVKLYTQMPWCSTVSQDLRKGMADLQEIHHHLYSKVLHARLEPSLMQKASWPLDWLGGARQIDPAEAKKGLQLPLLQPEEDILLAFKAGRDSTIFTTSRILRVDVKGVTGTRVEYRTVPYNSVLAFSVQTAGEISVFTGMPALPHVHQDLAGGAADLFAAHMLLSQKVLP